MSIPVAPWMRDELLLPLPPDAGAWGIVEFREDEEPRFVTFPDGASLAAAAGEQERVWFGWGPGDRHVRSLYEIEAVAAVVEARGARELSRALRESRLPSAALILAIVAGVLYWPQDRMLRLAALILAMLIGVRLWYRGVERAFTSWRTRRLLARDPRRWRLMQTREIRFGIHTQALASRLALGLGACLVLLWILMLYARPEAAIEALGLVKDRVRAGEWWRLLTCAFLHGGALHVGMNSFVGLSLAGIGSALVDEARLLLVFLVSAVAGSVASCLLLPDTTSIGASGGVLGWGGMLLGFALVHPSLRDCGLAARMARWVLLLTLFGLAGADFIDNAAHAGGLIAGTLLGALFARDRERPLPHRTDWSRPVRYAAYAAGALFLVWLAFTLVSARN